MTRLPFWEFMYYGFLITSLVLYLSLYIKNRKNIISHKRKTTQWGIVLSFLSMGILAAITGLVNPLNALGTSLLATAIAYFIIFIKYKD